MKWNPLFDPFIEAGYLGYSLRAVAHCQSSTSFVPLLVIRDLTLNSEEPIYEKVLSLEFDDPDSAMRYAMGKGRQIIDDVIQHSDLDEPVDYVH